VVNAPVLDLGGIRKGRKKKEKEGTTARRTKGERRRRKKGPRSFCHKAKEGRGRGKGNDYL